MVATKQLVGVGAGRLGSPPGAGAAGGSPNGPLPEKHDEAWDYAASTGALLGVALLVLSFAFDGHTVSEGPWALHALVNAVHVVTAAMWAGGVALLAVVVTRRHRRGVDAQTLQLAVRFSVVASIALVAAGVAGLALAMLIIDSVSQLWSTPWGRLLAAKAVLVAVAAACGGYNHRVLIPELERSVPQSASRFRTVVTVEALALVGVAVITALLVAASAT